MPPSPTSLSRPHAAPLFLGPIALSAFAALALGAGCGGGSAPPSGPVPPGPLQATLVATGFQLPTAVAQPPGDTRLFVCEQNTAQVRIVASGVVLPTPFLDLGAEASEGEELGLLGLAFHPDFQTNRRFYVSFTDNTPASVVREYQASAANPDVADVSTARVIFGPLAQPSPRHNGGCLQFGPDGMLYLSLGDGGELGADPSNRAQDVAQEFGKILRLDVEGPPFAPADNPFAATPGASPFVWALGLRNPWRFSFDSATGDLWVADVGNQTREEINHRPAGMGAGSNFGWRCSEGTSCTGLSGCTCGAADLVEPVHEYDTHAPTAYQDATCAVMGGFVYRGSALPGLVGRYVFADACSGQVLSIALEPGGTVDLLDHTAELLPAGGWNVVSLGEGADGELYLVDFRGSLWRIDPADEGTAESSSVPAAGGLAGAGEVEPGTAPAPGGPVEAVNAGHAERAGAGEVGAAGAARAGTPGAAVPEPATRAATPARTGLAAGARTGPAARPGEARPGGLPANAAALPDRGPLPAELAFDAYWWAGAGARLGEPDLVLPAGPNGRAWLATAVAASAAAGGSDPGLETLSALRAEVVAAAALAARELPPSDAAAPIAMFRARVLLDPQTWTAVRVSPLVRVPLRR